MVGVRECLQKAARHVLCGHPDAFNIEVAQRLVQHGSLNKTLLIKLRFGPYIVSSCLLLIVNKKATLRNRYFDGNTWKNKKHNASERCVKRRLSVSPSCARVSKGVRYGYTPWCSGDCCGFCGAPKSMTSRRLHNKRPREFVKGSQLAASPSRLHLRGSLHSNDKKNTIFIPSHEKRVLLTHRRVARVTARTSWSPASLPWQYSALAHAFYACKTDGVWTVDNF